jgi:hypothetical protein
MIENILGPAGSVKQNSRGRGCFRLGKPLSYPAGFPGNQPDPHDPDFSPSASGFTPLDPHLRYNINIFTTAAHEPLALSKTSKVLVAQAFQPVPEQPLEGGSTFSLSKS